MQINSTSTKLPQNFSANNSTKGLDIEFESGDYLGLSKSDIETIEKIISWKIIHEPFFYPSPGRTIILNNQVKIKGAGFFNPPNVSFSGLKRTLAPVPEDIMPMPPLDIAFKRDIIHVDPSHIYPYLMQSVHSNYAPVGGMTLERANNDQHMFKLLSESGLPSNTPLAVYRYSKMMIDSKQMGVSVSLLPENVIPITPYDIYICWYKNIPSQNKNVFELLCNLLGDEFDSKNPTHRLIIINNLAFIAGKLLIEFSTKAGLYRFSGSPDNWTMKSDINQPLYFSDVDTSETLNSIDSGQHIWEIVRNIISMLHQWIYFFLPSLSYSESGYHFSLFKEHDFVESILLGVFHGQPKIEIKKCSKKIWDFLNPVSLNINTEKNISLRGGEHYLQTYYDRPTFYFVVLSILKHLINTKFYQKAESNFNFDSYISNSIADPTHKEFFPFYNIENVNRLINQYK